MKRYICMRYRLGESFAIASTSPPPPDPVEEKPDLVPALDSWDEHRAVLKVEPYDEARVVVPAEALLFAVPQGEPIHDGNSLVESAYPRTVVVPRLTPSGAAFEVPIPTGLDPAISYIGQTVFGYRG